MYDNYNYPMGADTPDAPWNQKDPEPIDIDIDVEVTLSHKTTVSTTNYESYTDDEGCYEEEVHDSYQDIEKYYKEQHKTIPELLSELAKYIKCELAGGNLSYNRKQELMQMLDDCCGWAVENVEIENYNVK